MTIRDFLAPEPWLESAHGPRYLALRRRIEEAIDQGLLAPGDALPAEREIARLTGTSRVTARRAIESLVGDGRVEQRQGSGSFVLGTPPAGKPQARARLASLGEELAIRGIVPGTEVIEAGHFPARPEESLALGLGTDEPVTRLVRLRLGDGAPLALERTILPPGVLEKPKRAGASLYAALEAGGHRPVRALQRIGAATLGKREAKVLGAKKGAAALVFVRTGFLESGRAIEVTRATFLAGAFEIVAELRGGPAP